MASDLASTPRSGIPVQLCGDAHLSNFGVFGTPERNLVFDINDFDETLPGPWEWDVKRLAASLVVAGRDRGFPVKQRSEIVLAAVASLPNGDARLRSEVEPGGLVCAPRLRKDVCPDASELTAKQAANTDAAVAKARTKDSMRAFDKLTHLVDGERRIISDPPLIVPIEELFEGGVARPRGAAADAVARLPADAHDRPPLAARAVRPRPLRAQGRRRRQCRHPRLDRAVPRPRRHRSALPAGQGGAGVRARAVPRPQRVQQLRAARRRRPAPDAGCERRVPRLAARHRRQPRRATARLLRPPAARLEGQRRHRDDEAG